MTSVVAFVGSNLVKSVHTKEMRPLKEQWHRIMVILQLHKLYCFLMNAGAIREVAVVFQSLLSLNTFAHSLTNERLGYASKKSAMSNMP